VYPVVKRGNLFLAYIRWPTISEADFVNALAQSSKLSCQHDPAHEQNYDQDDEKIFHRMRLL
jgi:hypothetical protein